MPSIHAGKASTVLSGDNVTSVNGRVWLRVLNICHVNMSRVDIYDNLFMWDLGCHMIRWSKPYKKGDLSIVASSAVLGALLYNQLSWTNLSDDLLLMNTLYWLKDSDVSTNQILSHSFWALEVSASTQP